MSYQVIWLAPNFVNDAKRSMTSKMSVANLYRAFRSTNLSFQAPRTSQTPTWWRIWTNLSRIVCWQGRNLQSLKHRWCMPQLGWCLQASVVRACRPRPISAHQHHNPSDLIRLDQLRTFGAIHRMFPHFASVRNLWWQHVSKKEEDLRTQDELNIPKDGLDGL